MTAYLEHLGFRGSIEASLEDEVLHGKVMDIRSLLTYSAKTVTELKEAFQNLVAEYIDDCRRDGVTPDRPCNGSFNVRVGPDTHRNAVILARNEGITLNELVKRALEARIQLCTIDTGVKIFAEYTQVLPSFSRSLVDEHQDLVIAPMSADPYERSAFAGTTTH